MNADLHLGWSSGNQYYEYSFGTPTHVRFFIIVYYGQSFLHDLGGGIMLSCHWINSLLLGWLITVWGGLSCNHRCEIQLTKTPLGSQSETATINQPIQYWSAQLFKSRKGAVFRGLLIPLSIIAGNFVVRKI